MSKQDVLIVSAVYFQISFERYFGSIAQVAGGAVVLEGPRAPKGQDRHNSLPIAAPALSLSAH